MEQDEKLEKMAAMFEFEEREGYPCDTPEEVAGSLAAIENETQFLNKQNEKLKALLPVKTIPFAGNRYDDEILSCPYCGNINLHPTNTIEGTDESIRSEYAAYTQTNFWCEHCPSSVGLRMRFHKGLTYMTWQINDESTKE